MAEEFGPDPDAPADGARPAGRPPVRPRWRRVLRWCGIAAAALLVVVTISSFVYNRATDGRERPAAALYPGPYVQVGATRVAYSTWGSTGTPIVLLGGFAEPTWVWHDVAPLLAARHRVIAVDLPPFGFTQRVGDPSLDTWVALVEGVMRQLGLQRPLVVGHSLGAGVAAGIALRDPRLVSGIVLLDGDALRGGGGSSFRSVLGAVLIDPYFTSAWRLVTGSDTIFRFLLDRALGPDGPPVTRGMLDAFERPFRVEGTAAQFKRLAPHGIIGLAPADLTRISVPSTVVWGQFDDTDSPSAGRASAAALHAPFIVIPGAGHLSMLVRPAAVAAAIGNVAR